MFDNIYFQYPQFGALLILFIVCARYCKMRLNSIYFPHLTHFANSSFSSSKVLFFLKWLGVVMLVIAMMSPVKDKSFQLPPKNGHDIVLILDASESMKARGFDKQNYNFTRFDVVKNLASDFIDKRKNDNIGLVVFGTYSFIASPITYDSHILNKLVSQLRIAMAGKFTALYEALAQGVNLLKKSDAKSKVAILLTDGYNSPQNKFPFDVAMALAKKEHAKVYPIGIGSDFNRKVLLKIAKATGGVAFGASSASELKEVYKKIDELEKSKIKRESFSYLNYFYIYPLFISLISLMLYIFMRNKRGRN